MGMKVAAVSTLCQDARVFDAMMMAGTPCPYKGKIGKDALVAWKKNPDDVPSGSTSLEEENSYVNDVPVPPLPSDLPSGDDEEDILFKEWDGE